MNGTDAVAHSWPSVVEVGHLENGNEGLCGGTLIDLTTVLTAGWKTRYFSKQQKILGVCCSSSKSIFFYLDVISSLHFS